jgi:hypothetical protein
MTPMPPSPFTNSGVTDCPPEQAAAPSRQIDGVAADLSEIDCIEEIFVGARKLVDPDEHRFVLDVDRFMAELDEPPLFLRRA